MKARIILSLLLAVVLCLFGCTTENNYYVTPDDPSQEEQKTDTPDGEDENGDNEDGDNKVSLAEATKVTAINCSTATDFTGIEYFTELLSFVSSSAAILDLSQNSELYYISLENNKAITDLDLSKNSNLSTIDDKTFYNCYYLASVSLPAEVTTIGRFAFYCCFHSKPYLCNFFIVVTIGFRCGTKRSDNHSLADWREFVRSGGGKIAHCVVCR